MKIKYMATLVVLIVLLGAGGASAKSLYVLSDTNAASSPIQAYDIDATGITYQATHTTNSGWGEVGVAIDSNSGYLFITHESSGLLYLVNGTTMNAAGTVTAPGARNLAGIVVDEAKQRVYAVDRGTTTLFVYDWNANTKTLTAVSGSPFTLPNTAAYGIALDEGNDLLYVASYSNVVRYFDTATWTEQGTITLGQRAISIAIEDGKYMYTGSGFAGSNVLSKYDLVSNTETTINNNYGIIGLAVDQANGRVYATTGFSGDMVQVFDSSLTMIDNTADIGNPSGLCVPRTGISYNPLSFDKDDGLTTTTAGSQITYTLSYVNNNQVPVTGVTITDTVPEGVNFVSATGSGVESAGIVSWNIGTLSAGESGSVSMTVQESSGAVRTLTNYATISSNELTQTTQSDDTKITTSGNGGEIPEFPTIALPMIAILGLAFVMQRRREE